MEFSSFISECSPHDLMDKNIRGTYVFNLYIYMYIYISFFSLINKLVYVRFNEHHFPDGRPRGSSIKQYSVQYRSRKFRFKFVK